MEQQPTHYYETFKDQKGKIITGVLCEIKKLPESLRLTTVHNLKTIAVFKIAFKPHFILATRNEDLSATIIEAI